MQYMPGVFVGRAFDSGYLYVSQIRHVPPPHLRSVIIWSWLDPSFKWCRCSCYPSPLEVNTTRFLQFIFSVHLSYLSLFSRFFCHRESVWDLARRYFFSRQLPLLVSTSSDEGRSLPVFPSPWEFSVHSFALRFANRRLGSVHWRDRLADNTYSAQEDNFLRKRNSSDSCHHKCFASLCQFRHESQTFTKIPPAETGFQNYPSGHGISRFYWSCILHRPRSFLPLCVSPPSKMTTNWPLVWKISIYNYMRSTKG